MRVVMKHRQQPRHLPGAHVFEIDIRNHRARHVALALEAQDLLFQFHQAAALEAQFPQAPRAVQQVQMLQARKRRARAIQAVARFEQRLIEGLAVIGDQHAERLQMPRQGIQLAGFLAVIAHEKLADAETFGVMRPTPTRNAQVPVPPASPVVSVSRNAHSCGGTSRTAPCDKVSSRSPAAPPVRSAPRSRDGDGAHKTFQSRNVFRVRSRFPRLETIPARGISVEKCAKPPWNKAFPAFRIFHRTPRQRAPCAGAEPPVDLVTRSSPLRCQHSIRCAESTETAVAAVENVRIARNPLKIDVFCSFLFTPGLRIPYDAVVNARLSLLAAVARDENATYSIGRIRFSKKEQYGSSKNDAVAIDQEAGGDRRRS